MTIAPPPGSLLAVAAPAPAPSAGPDRTPGSASSPRRAAWRQRRNWAVLGLVFLLIAVGLIVVSVATTRIDKLSFEPDNHGPSGFRGVAQVLRAEGVDVHVTRSWKDAVSTADAQRATLVMMDAPALSDDALRDLYSAPRTMVLLDPTSHSLELAFPNARIAGVPHLSAPVTAQCSLPAAENAQRITPTLTFSGADQMCFPTDAGAGLISEDRDGTQMIALDATTLFTNGEITNGNNAALALGVLGGNPTVVWYVPNLADTDREYTGDPTLADYAPDWVTPAMYLLFAAALAAAIWRGRRFGPLVAERLPVSVRVSETLEGRARLYARSRDTRHVASVLRRAATARIGAHLGMGKRTSMNTVATAAAAALGVPPDRVRDILAGPVPTNDQELVELSDRLTRLDAAIGAAVRAEGKRS